MRRIVISPTSRCNFKCKTCLREYGKNQALDLDFDVIKKAIYGIKKLQYNHVSITGGEPILYPKFKELLELIASEKMNFNIVSNSFYWKKYLPYIRKYKNSYLRFMSLSLDGATESVHNDIRQNGSYEKVIEAVRAFKTEGIIVRISYCLNKINQHQIEEVILLAEKLKIDELIFICAIKTNFNKEIVLTKTERKNCLEKIKTLKNKYKVPISACSSLVDSEAICFCNELNLTAMMINSNGELVFCCDSIRGGAVVGSLENESIFNLYMKALDIVNDIKKVRAKTLYSGKVPDEFGGCHFCNNFLAKYIRK